MNFSKAFKHLEKDEVLSFLIKRFGDEITLKDRYESNYAKAISLLIIEQQVSFKAAIRIKERFLKLITGKSNDEVIKIKNEEMKKVGLSKRKVEYIKNTYLFFDKYKVEFEYLNENEIVKELSKIKGVGKWTAEMFLIFILFKENIFSKGDLALINSIKKNYKKEKLSDIDLEKIVEKWSPYKTTASLLLWKSIEEKIFYSK
ncbi:MAG: DNA-3-methyladenine glycosylase family protein [Flavobacteriaceae bacterium]